MTLSAMVLTASRPTPLVAAHLYPPASSLLTSVRVSTMPFCAVLTRGDSSSGVSEDSDEEAEDSRAQETVGEGLPLALHSMETEAPRRTTRWPLGGCVITLGGTDKRIKIRVRERKLITKY